MNYYESGWYDRVARVFAVMSFDPRAAENPPTDQGGPPPAGENIPSPLALSFQRTGGDIVYWSFEKTPEPGIRSVWLVASNRDYVSNPLWPPNFDALVSRIPTSYDNIGIGIGVQSCQVQKFIVLVELDSQTTVGKDGTGHIRCSGMPEFQGLDGDAYPLGNAGFVLTVGKYVRVDLKVERSYQPGGYPPPSRVTEIFTPAAPGGVNRLYFPPKIYCSYGHQFFGEGAMWGPSVQFASGSFPPVPEDATDVQWRLFDVVTSEG